MKMPIDTEGQHLIAIMTIDDCPPKTASWKYALTCVLVILGSLFAYDFKISAAPSRHHPNVLFIAVDDLRPELQCYASQVMKPRAITPHLDRLAASGILFSHAYCNQAVCGASRLSLMTGLYPEFTGERTYHVTDWRTRWPHVVTINQHFRANGYTTVGLGKIYHGTAGPGVDPANWSEWIQVKGATYAHPESMLNMRTSRTSTPGAQTTKSRGPCTESADVEDHVYADGMRAREGARQIHTLAQLDKPFFLAVGFTKPHLPFNAPTRYWNLYQRVDFALPDNRSWPPGYPEWARNRQPGELRAYSDVPSRGTPADYPDELNKRMLHGYHACVSYTDRNVGVLLEALETADIADDTIVFFWGDHGWKLGDHTSWCKHTNFECDTRVPLIIRNPTMPKAQGTSEALIELIDVYPTLCELCALEPPQHLQGKSFAPILKNPSIAHRVYAYSSYPHTNSKTKQRVIGHSIRSTRFRYTEWWDQERDEVVARVATDMKADPGETTNILPSQTFPMNQWSTHLRQRVIQSRMSPLE